MEQIETAIAAIRQKEKEIQDLLLVIADQNGEATTEASQFFTEGLKWSEMAANNLELV